MHRERGFTLIETIAVLTLLAIVAGFSTLYIANSMRSYYNSQSKALLMSRARLAVEQITRYARAAVPYSLRVSSSGDCLELLPSTSGANYEGQVADSYNGASATSAITTSPISSDLGNILYAVIGALSSDEVYQASSPMPVAAVGSYASTGVTFSGGHQFIRNSAHQRVFLADDPLRFCLSGSNLELREDYGFNTDALTDSTPSGATTSIMATDVSSNGGADIFSLDPADEDLNTTLTINLVFSEDSNQLVIEHRVVLQNVP